MRVDGKQVAELGALPFVVAMEQLLRAEAARHGLPQPDIHVTTNVSRPDGGIDGRTEVAGASASDRIPCGLGLWQFKTGRVASDHAPAALRAILEARRVAEAMERGGAFRLALAVQIGDKRSAVEQALRAEAGRLGYLPSRVSLCDADDIAAWASEHPAVWGHFGIELGGAVPFQRWGRMLDRQAPLVSDEARDSMRERLREVLRTDGNRPVVCVRGISGVGKTTFVHGALDTPAVRDEVLYASALEDARSVVSEVTRNLRLSTILVVDECDDSDVKWLASRAKACDGRLSVVAIIGPLPSGRAERTVPDGIEELTIEGLPRERMNELLLAVAPGASAEQRGFVVAIADGIPRIAVMFSRALARDPRLNLTAVTREQAFEAWTRRLVDDEQSLDVLRALSVATRVGWEAELEFEGEAWAAAYELGPWRRVRDVADKLKAVQLLRPQGRRHLYVWPHPLAVALAAQAWNAQGPSLLSRVARVPSESFSDRVYERLRDVSDNPHVRGVAERLLATLPVFSSAQSVDQIDNAQALAVLMESNPDAGLAKLEDLLAGQPADVLYAFAHGQREVVDVLARMAWRGQFFSRAERLLRLLAAHDGAHWADPDAQVGAYFVPEASRSGVVMRRRFLSYGVTSTWSRLFAIRRAPTSVDVRTRHAVLEQVLRSSSAQDRRIAVEALSDSLGIAASVGGMEILGSLPPEPRWVPSPAEEHASSLLAWRMLSSAVGDRDPAVRSAASDALMATAMFEAAHGRGDAVAAELERWAPAIGLAVVAQRIEEIVQRIQVLDQKPSTVELADARTRLQKRVAEAID
ncbi:MAG: hypothetical protein EPO40_01690 [Myxococcaceae bacterium]|nr:MAG: hypothetical protein EPO40_01690 [Myxococcaceae bacterium]